jgi:hypothetical protein
MKGGLQVDSSPLAKIASRMKEVRVTELRLSESSGAEPVPRSAHLSWTQPQGITEPPGQLGSLANPCISSALPRFLHVSYCRITR